jgi:peroxiredoxin
VSISRQQLGDDAIAVGSTIPSFTATDEHGKIFDSQSLAGQPVLIKFFRGHW